MSHQPSRKFVAAVSIFALCTAPVALGLYIEHWGLLDPLPVGEKFPSIEALSLNGSTFLQDSLTDKKLLLIFFTTGCSHCRTELSNLDRLSQKYAQEIEIVGISLDDREATSALQKDLSLKIPLFLGNNERTKNLLRFPILPALFCLDERHILRKYITGERSIQFDENLIREFAASGSVR